MLWGLGIFIMVAVLVGVFVAAVKKKMGPSTIVALVFAGIVVGLVVPNAPDLAGLVLKTGDKTAYSVQLEKRVEKKVQQVETDATEVRQMKEQIQMIVGRLEKGEQATQEASKKLRDLQKRRLSNEQKQILVKALSPFQGQTVFIGEDFRADDGPELVQDFKDVFVEAKWKLEGESDSDVITAYRGAPIGIEIYTNKAEMNAGRILESAKVLNEALFKLGMIQQAAIIGSETTPIGRVEVGIGRRP